MQWNLIKLRKENGHTQEDLAKVIHKSVSTYRNKENGEVQFLSDEMFAIADFYQKDISEIFLPTKYTFRKQKI